MKTKSALLAVLLASFACASVAQDAFPSRSMRIVVPFPPGGGPDIMARLLAQRMGENLKQSVVVENRAGATGIIGTEHVAKSAPDGYTMLVGTPGPMTIAGGSGRKLSYDPLKDFAGVSQGVLLTPIMVVNNNAPYKTVADLVAAAKAKPGAINYGSAGIGNSQHLAVELLNQMGGINTVHIPFPGTVVGMTAVMNGQIEFFFADPSALPFVRGGKLRALAVGTMIRSKQLPDVPTVNESGVPGYEYANWYGIVVPAKTPRAVVQRLNREVHAVLNAQDIREKLITAGMDPAPSTPEALDAFLPKDQEKWAKVVRTAGIKFD